MDNLKIYNATRNVPKEAQKEIKGGRMSGKTDINPMWRIKALTEQFGPCGIGWKYVITKQWLEKGGKDEVSAFVNIEIFIKVDNKWSDAIPGTGGSSFVASEKNGLFTSDECFKMAMTDAISVSCKALGFGADIYWEKDISKYDKPQETQKYNDNITTQMLIDMAKSKGYDETSICKKYNAKEVKFIKQDDKKLAYEGFKNLPDSGGK